MVGERPQEPPVPRDSSGEPLTNAAVVEAMRSVAVDDRPETRAMLFQLLLETTLLVVTPAGPEQPTERTAQAGESLSIVTSSDEDGTVMPVFTSVETMSRWLTQRAGYLALPSSTLFQMASAGGTGKIVLDPGSPTWGLVNRYEIEQLARGRLPLGRSGDIVSAATEVRIGKPSDPPSAEALDALRASLDAVTSARRAWYFLLQQGDLAPELCVGIEFDAGVDPDAGPMRWVIDAAGDASPDVASLSFLVADDGWIASFDNGAGELFFSRR